MIPAIFMHIQKAAGTTIVELARNHYGIDNVTSHGDHLDGLTCDDNPKVFFGKTNIRTRFQNKLFISGHFGYDFCTAFMNERYSFTFLRDPMERIVSFYYFCRSRLATEFTVYKIAQDKSLHDFLTLGLEDIRVRGLIWNIQAWQLAHGYCNSWGPTLMTAHTKDIASWASAHIKNFSFIGTVENFPASRDKVLADLGIPIPPNDYKVNATTDRPKIAELPPETRKLLKKFTSLEYPLYDAIANAESGGKSKPKCGLLRRVYRMFKLL